MADAKDEETTVPTRRSSWSAALAQLPGFPDKAPVPGLPPKGAQAVSPLGKDGDETDDLAGRDR